MPEDNLVKNPVGELAKRFLFTFVMGVVVYRLGVVVPVPGVNVHALQEMINNAGTGALDKMLQYANMFNGGAIANASIFGLGVMPYISASIIFQLLAFSFPALKELQKEGEVGRRKINQYTRYATVAICLVQAGIASFALVGQTTSGGTPFVNADNATVFVIQSMLIITTGSMVLLWIAEQITRHGVGNGVSVVIMISILSAFPGAVNKLAGSNNFEVGTALILVFILVAVIAAMVLLSTARRRINLEQQRRVQGNKIYGGGQTQLPLMLNQANVIPVIFASPVMVIFGFMSAYVFGYGTSGYRYLFAGLIIFFTYFYISITQDLNDMANHFKQAGFFIRGVKPGRNTVEYIEHRRNRLTFIGAFALALIALMPDILGGAINLDSQASQVLLGGVGLLIVVGVSLDIIQKVGSHLMAGQTMQGATTAPGKGGKRGGGKRY
ncbi:MAG: preprotein translocase subunit SecY [Planctomycetes bacterium]|nr:preprotein translocase subunit SecY [Planctomycetota bacterium]